MLGTSLIGSALYSQSLIKQETVDSDNPYQFGAGAQLALQKANGINKLTSSTNLSSQEDTESTLTAGVAGEGSVAVETFGGRNLILYANGSIGWGANKAQRSDIEIQAKQHLGEEDADHQFSAVAGYSYSNARLVTKGNNEDRAVEGIVIDAKKRKLDNSGDETIEDIFIPLSSLEQFMTVANINIHQHDLNLGVEANLGFDWGVLHFAAAYHQRWKNQGEEIKNIKFDYQKKVSTADLANDHEITAGDETVTMDQFRNDPNYEILDEGVVYMSGSEPTADYGSSLNVQTKTKTSNVKVALGAEILENTLFFGLEGSFSVGKPQGPIANQPGLSNVTATARYTPNGKDQFILSYNHSNHATDVGANMKSNTFQATYIRTFGGTTKQE